MTFLSQSDKKEHALAGLRIYSIWAGMHQRCYNTNNQHWKNYGGRGIKICRRWLCLATFLADMGHPPDGCSIERINNDGDYEPGNCRWATQEQQNENTRRNKYLELKGQSKTIKAWAKEYNLDPQALSERVRRGWSVERAVSTPTKRGYEEAREKHNAQSKSYWKQKGNIYKANSIAKKGLATD
jgi:hypothetical protein